MAPALRPDARNADYYAHAFDGEDDDPQDDFYPGERICPPQSGLGGNPLLRVYVAIFLALGAGWALLTDYSPLRFLPPDLSASVLAMIEDYAPSLPKAAPPPERVGAGVAAALAPAPPLAETTPEREIVEAPGSTAGEPAPPAPAAEAPASDAPAADEPTADAPPAPLPPPTVDPADPYQKKAIAVGLHPDISRAVLARLSADDYRNAGVAIKSALAKTADADVFVWPQQPKPERALFRVHFVAGASADCRRYVVTVTKDRWSTTAPAMEKCGADPARSRTKKASAETKQDRPAERGQLR